MLAAAIVGSLIAIANPDNRGGGRLLCFSCTYQTPVSSAMRQKIPARQRQASTAPKLCKTTMKTAAQRNDTMTRSENTTSVSNDVVRTTPPTLLFKCSLNE